MVLFFPSGVAVGVTDVTNGSQRSFYAVASQDLPFGYRLHVGTGSGQYDRFFAGLEKRMSPLGLSGGSRSFPTTVLMVEYDGHVMNYGARVTGRWLETGCRLLSEKPLRGDKLYQLNFDVESLIKTFFFRQIIVEKLKGGEKCDRLAKAIFQRFRKEGVR